MNEAMKIPTEASSVATNASGPHPQPEWRKQQAVDKLNTLVQRVSDDYDLDVWIVNEFVAVAEELRLLNVTLKF